MIIKLTHEQIEEAVRHYIHLKGHTTIEKLEFGFEPIRLLKLNCDVTIKKEK
jgi:hypothetical protein